ncbi:MAG TPA: hypothetical protein VFD49_21205 [Candidatus Dormibacteraeota bacterium]|nr:hypothetical protein [Candidatus Dormibacteraeota bacterium]
MLVFGALWLASLVFARAGKGGSPTIYWLAGSLLAYLITGWYLWRARRALGARVALLRFAALGVATVLGIGLLSWLSMRLGLLPLTGAALGYVVLAPVCRRSRPMAVLTSGLLVATLLVASDPAPPVEWALVAAYGVALLGYEAVRWARA